LGNNKEKKVYDCFHNVATKSDYGKLVENSDDNNVITAMIAKMVLANS